MTKWVHLCYFACFNNNESTREQTYMAAEKLKELGVQNQRFPASNTWSQDKRTSTNRKAAAPLADQNRTAKTQAGDNDTLASSTYVSPSYNTCQSWECKQYLYAALRSGLYSLMSGMYCRINNHRKWGLLANVSLMFACSLPIVYANK